MSRPSLTERISLTKKAREEKQRARRRRVVSKRDGMRYEVDGESLLCFCSNDYLGLAQHFTVSSAFQDAAARLGTGSGASHLVCGHFSEHDALEREVAEWLGYPSALLFSSGYQANLAVAQAFLGEGDVSIQDRLNHASLIDAARLAGASLRRYPHVDAEGALRQLRGNPEGAAMVVTDGVFSMEGDVAPVRALALIARVQHATFVVDDAHGVGILGTDGRGTVAAAGLGLNEVPLQVVTLGKALGGEGALVLGDQAHIEHLKQNARPYIYTTASAPASAAASRVALQLARRESWRRERVFANLARLRQGLLGAGFELPGSDSAIQSIPCGSDEIAMAMSAALEAQGIWVSAIRPPTVPENSARLRVTLSALHSDADIDSLIAALRWSRDAVGTGYRAE